MKNAVSQNQLIREQERNLWVHTFSFREHKVLHQVKVQGPHQGSRTVHQNHKVWRSTILMILKFFNLPSQGKKPVAKHQLNIPYLRVQVWRILSRIIHQDPCRKVPAPNDLKRSNRAQVNQLSTTEEAEGELTRLITPEYSEA